MLLAPATCIPSSQLNGEKAAPFHKHLLLELRLQRVGLKSARVPDKITCKSLAEGQR